MTQNSQPDRTLPPEIAALLQPQHSWPSLRLRLEGMIDQERGALALSVRDGDAEIGSMRRRLLEYLERLLRTCMEERANG